MENCYEYSTYNNNSHHKVRVNRQASNMDALKNRKYEKGKGKGETGRVVEGLEAVSYTHLTLPTNREV